MKEDYTLQAGKALTDIYGRKLSSPHYFVAFTTTRNATKHDIIDEIHAYRKFVKPSSLKPPVAVLVCRSRRLSVQEDKRDLVLTPVLSGSELTMAHIWNRQLAVAVALNDMDLRFEGSSLFGKRRNCRDVANSLLFNMYALPPIWADDVANHQESMDDLLNRLHKDLTQPVCINQKLVDLEISRFKQDDLLNKKYKAAPAL